MLKSNLKRFLYKMIEIVFQNFPLYLLFNVCLISPSHYSRYVDFATFIITGFCIFKPKLQTECYSTKIINLFFVGKCPTNKEKMFKILVKTPTPSELISTHCELPLCAAAIKMCRVFLQLESRTTMHQNNRKMKREISYLAKLSLRLSFTFLL